jgi:2-(1,2-epoxy-1,2-dihydrophenyl)acetyl-CoA isomerase
MSDCLLEKRPDGVALITLNRPESLNSLGGELPRLFAEYLQDCEHDRAVRCVAVTGAGRAFCAGGDVRNMPGRDGGEPGNPREAPEVVAGLEREIALLRAGHNAVSLKLHTIPKPTVALVNGHAVGAGLSIALACDIRICGEQARFGTAFRNVGRSGDYGGSYFLSKLVGAGRARELYFTAEVLNAQRALELGIANRVVPQERLLEEGLAFCAKLASGPTAAFGRMKANLNLAETGNLQAVLDQEAINQRFAGMSPDAREAVRAFLEKREPNFRGE